jgi:hypothetical protein
LEQFQHASCLTLAAVPDVYALLQQRQQQPQTRHWRQQQLPRLLLVTLLQLPGKQALVRAAAAVAASMQRQPQVLCMKILRELFCQRAALSAVQVQDSRRLDPRCSLHLRAAQASALHAAAAVTKYCQLNLAQQQRGLLLHQQLRQQAAAVVLVAAVLMLLQQASTAGGGATAAALAVQLP